MNQSAKYDYIVSLGYRCSSAGILKSLGIKHESYPFDWMVSRLPVIEHCIQTDFAEFLHTANYQCVRGMTNHYSSLDTSSRQWICNESICFNKYYETTRCISPNIDLYLPKPMNPEYDAYGYKLMMNHRNIKSTKEDEEYFARCVERWNRIRTSPTANILYLYIHPAVFYEEFFLIKSKLIEDIRRFHRTSIMTPTTNSITIPKLNRDGIYIIPVKTQYDFPTEHCAKYVLEEQSDDISTPGCRICILWANRNFIDAGEIFMGNCHAETYVIQDYLRMRM